MDKALPFWQCGRLARELNRVHGSAGEKNLSMMYEAPVKTKKQANQAMIIKDKAVIDSVFLFRNVAVDCYHSSLSSEVEAPGLLLMNDGQNMEELGLQAILHQSLVQYPVASPLLCVAIHAGDRMQEYGTAGRPDYLGRGEKAGLYSRFIFEELIPWLQARFGITRFASKAFAGFSLGGLSALDMVWNNPAAFNVAGVFSGSFWWRTRALDAGYNEATDRIMHSIVREGKYVPNQRFYFQTGALDETADRNNNGIIDSIDDTLSLIDELKRKGYGSNDIRYLELPEGRHDIATWASAMPDFLGWLHEVNGKDEAGMEESGETQLLTAHHQKKSLD